ncbi:hypothetical protein ACOSQ4_016278 [Xanthoceras sorbifolium]
MINMILLNRGVQVEDAVGSHVCTPSHVFTPQSQHGSVPMTQDMSQFENAQCHLLHWYPYDDSEAQIVAEGRISSTNPNDKIHNMPLGRGYWRVWIDDQHTLYVAIHILLATHIKRCFKFIFGNVRLILSLSATATYSLCYFKWL